VRRRPAGAARPRQYEFARLNLTYVITSKRKLAQLVDEGKVSGWDDPRMPTIVGLRRRGYTPESLQLFAERIGVTKSDSWIDYSTLEGCLREDLENKAHRGMAVLDPVKLVLTNWDEVFGRRATWSPAPSPPCPTAPEELPNPAARAPLQPSAKRCGSSAKTLKKCRPRATSACSPATRCA
jgi:glutaminyl-tRNA synthetase